MRDLVTIRTIEKIEPIPDADMIEAAFVDGWCVVVGKGEFQPGDKCVYFEVDSFLPLDDPRFTFLGPRGTKVIDEREGHVLKTARLRGVYSQGLIKPFAEFEDQILLAESQGETLADMLGVFKYEPPIPAELSGSVLGFLPSWVPKTDEERIQNLPEFLDIMQFLPGRDDHGTWEATEKVDGTSMTVYADNRLMPPDEYEALTQWEKDLLAEHPSFGVCGRNYDYEEFFTKPDGTVTQNTLWVIARKYGLIDVLRGFANMQVAVQGEAFGEGIQHNPLGVKGQHFAAFAFIVNGRRVPFAEWPEEIKALSVPVYPLSPPETFEEALEQAEQRSLIGPALGGPDKPAEGIVWRHPVETDVPTSGGTRRASVKVVSNRYLLKHDR